MPSQTSQQPAPIGPRGDRPNIVIIVADSWRGDVLGHAGNPGAVTPHLDELVATDAVSFTAAFSQGAVCTPSRCAFLSGRYPHVRGHRTQHHRLQSDEPHFVRRLHRSGYTVWWGGGGDQLEPQAAVPWAVRHTPERFPPEHPFGADPHQDQRWRPEPGQPGYYSFFAGTLEPNLADGRRYDNDWYHTDAARRWLVEEARSTEPFCLMLNLTFPHPPYAVEPVWRDKINSALLPDRIPRPNQDQLNRKPLITRGLIAGLELSGYSDRQWRELRATYYAMCARVDHQVGMIIEALRTAGCYDDTAIFFFADHGDYTGDFDLAEKNQNTFEDPITRVPLIIKPPASTPTVPGTRDALVELIDVSATVADLTKLPAEQTTFGRTLLPLIMDPRAPGRDACFCEGGRLADEQHCMELEARQDPEGLYYPRMRLQRDPGPAHGKAVMCRTRTHKYIYRLYESDELYALTADPQELDNRIGDPHLSQVAEQLRTRILQHLVETADAVPISCQDTS